MAAVFVPNPNLNSFIMKHNFTGLLRAPMRVVLYAALVLMAGLYGCSRTADTPAPPLAV